MSTNMNISQGKIPYFVSFSLSELTLVKKLRNVDFEGY